MNKKIGATKVKLLIQSAPDWKDTLVDLTGLSYSSGSTTHQKIMSNEGEVLAETVLNLYRPLKGKALWLHTNKLDWNIVKTKSGALLLVPTWKAGYGSHGKPPTTAA